MLDQPFSVVPSNFLVNIWPIGYDAVLGLVLKRIYWLTPSQIHMRDYFIRWRYEILQAEAFAPTPLDGYNYIRT
jgi:hypothetical protein